MKKVILSLAIAMCSLPCFAQLGAPTRETLDTIVVTSADYMQNEIDMESAPLKSITGSNGSLYYYFVESESKIYIGNSTYIKNAPTDARVNEYEETWGGHINYFVYTNAKVNGKSASIVKVISRSDCADYPTRKYVIADYSFIGFSVRDLRNVLETNSEE